MAAVADVTEILSNQAEASTAVGSLPHIFEEARKWLCSAIGKKPPTASTELMTRFPDGSDRIETYDDTTRLGRAIMGSSGSLVKLEIASLSEDGRAGSLADAGSGVVVTDNGLIASCAHQLNLKGADKLYVNLGNGDLRLGSVVERDKEHDLALLTVEKRSPEEKFSAAKLAPAEQRMARSSPVFALGYPRPYHQLSVSLGKFSDVVPLNKHPTRPLFEEEDLSRQVVQFRGNSQPGNSGGGLFNKNGALIGIVGRGDGNKFVGFAYPNSDLDALIARVSHQSG